MKHSIPFTLLLLVCLLWNSPALLAQNVTFEAFADARQVVENGFFEVTFTLENAEGTDFDPPPFRDFKVVNGPSRSQSTTIINGEVTRKTSFAYTLKPRRTGIFNIGSAFIKVKGETYKTKALRIEVVESRAGEGQGKEVFLEAVASVPQAYVGQQVLVDYKIYTSVDIDSYNVLEEGDYQGFFAQDVRRFDGRLMREVINGQQYTTKIIKRVALFPQQAGPLTIEPLELQLGIVKNSGRADGFFFNRQMRRLSVASEPLTINVQPLPENAPPSFTGAVGDYTFTAQISRQTLTTDDALTIRMSMLGDGDVKRVQPPSLGLGEDFEVYEPKIVQEANLERDGRIEGRKIVEYVAIPKNPGQYDIAPEFTYFDPDTVAYVTLQAGTTPVSVRQGVNQPSTTVLPEGEVEAQEDIRFIKTNARFTKNRTTFFGSDVFWVLAGFPILGFLGVFFMKRRKQQRANVDPAILRRQKAQQVAQEHLAAAKTHLDEKEARKFYDEVSRAMQGYICDKLNLPTAELSKAVIQEKLEKLEVAPEHIERFLHIIQTCEMALFARKDNAEAMQSTYDDTLTVLSKIEEGIERKG